MIIYNDYGTEELLFDMPCNVDGLGNIYPVCVKDYKKFQKYMHFLVFSPKHLNISEDYKLLETIIMSIVASRCENVNDNDKLSKCMIEVLSEFAELVSIVTKTNISFDIIGGSYVFNNSDNSVFVNAYNFEKFRGIVLKQNLMREPKIFEDKLYEDMYYRAIKANRKKGVSIEDIIITVIQNMKYDFDYVLKLNIFQLNALYLRIAHVKNSDAITIYRTCSSKLPDVNYTDGIIDNLFKENDDSDLFADLGGVSDKLS